MIVKVSDHPIACLCMFKNYVGRKVHKSHKNEETHVLAVEKSHVCCAIFCETDLVAESSLLNAKFTLEPRCEKTGLRGFRPGPTQTGLYSHRRWLDA